jgi:putative hydrolase of the HAD superfamily
MLVVFDLDDTLYLERDYVRSGFQAVARYAELRGIAGVFAKAWRLFNEGSRRTILDRTLEELGVPYDVELIRQFVEIYRNHAPDIHLPEDAVNCLERLKGIADLGLITDGPSVSQWNKVRALRLDLRIPRIVVTSDLEGAAAKPSTASYLLLEAGRRERLRIYIGDNPHKDFSGARALGWRCIRVRRPAGLYAGDDDDPAAPPDQAVSDLLEVPRILARWEACFHSGALTQAGSNHSEEGLP